MQTKAHLLLGGATVAHWSICGTQTAANPTHTADLTPGKTTWEIKEKSINKTQFHWFMNSPSTTFQLVKHGCAEELWAKVLQQTFVPTYFISWSLPTCKKPLILQATLLKTILGM